MWKRPFGKTSAGREVELYTLANSNKVEIEVTNREGNKSTLIVRRISCCRPILLARRKKASAGRSCSKDPQDLVSGMLASAPALR